MLLLAAGWRRIAARNGLNNSGGCCEAGFNLAASLSLVWLRNDAISAAAHGLPKGRGIL
jgi:hypothetical protein